MSNKRNGEHRSAVVLFSAAVMIGLFALTVMTFDRGHTGTTSNETLLGTTGITELRPPLDRAPGQPVVGK
jgi:hypothetical protein